MSSLQHKLYNYEANPPEHTWDRIAASLDESELSNQFPATLQEMEVMPPLSAWDKIALSLDEEKETEAPVVPMRKRSIGFVRYAAAAIFIGAVAFGIIRLTTGNDNSATAEAETKNPAVSIPTKSVDPAEKITTTPALTQTSTSSEDNKKTVRSIPAVKATRNAAYAQERSTRTELAHEADYSQAIYTYNDHVPTIAERYITLLTPDGSFIRMAKKWSNLLCCVSGEDQDADCKDQLKKWQQKIASSPVAPAPGNFMDLLDLVNSLNEDTQL